MLNKKLLLLLITVFSVLSLQAKVSLKQENLEIYDVKGDTAKIKKTKLKIGQSGIIRHTYKNNHSIILANASVIKSFDEYSLIKFTPFTQLEQKALPNVSTSVKNKDIFILNFLYSSSLLVTPNQDAFVKTRDMFPSHNFIHSDILASYLKLENSPYPSRKQIKEYSKKVSIGTIFYVIENKVFIIDTKTFKIISTEEIKYNKNKVQLPFYTRIEKIKKGNFDFSSTEYIDSELSDIEKYNKYYKNFIGISND